MRKNMAFVAFAESYHKKNQIIQKIENLTIEIDHLNSKLFALKDEKLFAEKGISDVKKNIHMAELELKQLDDQEKNKKQRLLTTKNAKEYESFLREIDVLAGKKPSLEDGIFSLWERYEQASIDLKKLEQKIEIESGEILNLIEQKKQEIAEYVSLREKIEQLILENGKLIGPELNNAFLSRLHVFANPAVPVVKGSCTGCFNAVPQVEFLKLEQGHILNCMSCNRLLYLARSES